VALERMRRIFRFIMYLRVDEGCVVRVSEGQEGVVLVVGPIL
jgi:hypothetical protein